MLGKSAVRFAVWWLNRATLRIEDRTRLINAMLSDINALPLREIITTNAAQQVCIQGEPLDYERALALKGSAMAALSNPARRLVLEQVYAIAGKRGIVEGDEPVKLLFYRAAIWFGLQEEEHLKILAQE